MRLRWTTLSICAVAGSLWYFMALKIVHKFLMEPAGRWPYDYAVSYAAGWLAIHGQSALAYDHMSMSAFALRTFGFQPEGSWPYPPQTFFLAMPFSLLSPFVADVTYKVTGELLLFAVCRFALKLDWRWFPVIGLSPVALLNIVSGQNGLFTGAVFCAGLSLLPAFPYWSGFLVGFLAVKPQIAILVVSCLLLTRNRRAIAGAATSSCILCLAALLAFGPHPWYLFIHDVPSVMARYMDHLVVTPLGQTLLATVYPSLLRLGMPHAPAMVLQAGVSVLSVGAAVAAWRDHRTMSSGARLIGASALTMLATPYGFCYDMVPASVGIALLLKERGLASFSFREAAVLASLWIWPVLATFPSVFGTVPPLAPFLCVAASLVAWHSKTVGSLSEHA